MSRRPLNAIGWIGSVLGGLLALFSGGCSLYLTTGYTSGRGLTFDDGNLEIIAVIGGIPFAVGMIVLALSLLFGRRNKEAPNDG